MSFLLLKYGAEVTISFPMVKRGVVDFAATGDWTPASGDAKVSKNQANFANTTNTPAAVGGTGSVGWKLTLTATEMQAAEVVVQIVDAATKAVEDQFIIIRTFGNASAYYLPDFSDTVRLGLTALPNANAEAAGGLYTRGTGAGQINQPANGIADANTVRWNNTAPSNLISGRVDASVGVNNDKTGYTASSVTDKTGYTVSTVQDKTGYALSSAGVQAIWDALTSALTTVGSIGKLLVDNINATISSRLAAASYTTPPTAIENADALLDRNMATGTDTGGRTVRNALRALRNRIAIVTGTLTVYKEDDTTSAWTGAVTTGAGNPINEIDPT